MSDLRALYEAACRNELPGEVVEALEVWETPGGQPREAHHVFMVGRRVVLPSGQVCDDWNVGVRGSWKLSLWAKRNGRPEIVEREKKDLDFLARVWRGGV